MTIPSPGVYHNLPIDEYAAAGRVGHGAYSLLARGASLLQVHHYLYRTVEPSPQMRLGSLAHTAILEPDQLEIRYQVAPDGLRFDKRTTKFKGATEAAEGRELVKPKEWDTARRMREEVERNTMVYDLLRTRTATEVSLFYDEHKSGLPMRSRPDMVCPAAWCDLKTTESIPTDAWVSRMIDDGGLHIQDRITHRAREALGLIDWPAHQLTIVVQTVAPFEVRCVCIDSQALAVADAVLDDWTPLLVRAMTEGAWRRPAKIGTINLPPYAIARSLSVQGGD